MPAQLFTMFLSRAGRLHVFRVALAVCLGVATVMLMDATNTFYFAWYRYVCTHFMHTPRAKENCQLAVPRNDISLITPTPLSHTHRAVLIMSTTLQAGLA
jgi:hypothetical protein